MLFTTMVSFLIKFFLFALFYNILLAASAASIMKQLIGADDYFAPIPHFEEMTPSPLIHIVFFLYFF